MVYNKKEQRNLESLQKDLIRAEELYDLGQFEETFKISDRVYQDSLVLNNNLLAFDAIIFKVTIPIQLGNLDKVPDLINQAENLLQIMSGDSLKEVELKKIDLLSLKGQLSFTKGEYGNSVEIHKKVLIRRNLPEPLILLVTVWLWEVKLKIPYLISSKV